MEDKPFNVISPSDALQTLGFNRVVVKVIVGLTVTVTVNEDPTHVPDVGVTV